MTKKDFSQFLRIAYGSAGELRTQTIIAHELSYVDTTTYTPLMEYISEVERMLNNLIRSLLS